MKSGYYYQRWLKLLAWWDSFKTLMSGFAWGFFCIVLFFFLCFFWMFKLSWKGPGRWGLVVVVPMDAMNFSCVILDCNVRTDCEVGSESTVWKGNVQIVHVYWGWFWSILNRFAALTKNKSLRPEIMIQKCVYLQVFGMSFGRISLWNIWVLTPGSKVSPVAMFALSLAGNEDKHAQRDWAASAHHETWVFIKSSLQGEGFSLLFYI